jgi:hypothetical protein
MWPVAPTAVVGLVVEEPAAQVDQGITAPLGGVAGGFAVDIIGGGESQGGVDDRSAFGVEAAGELAASVQDPGQVQRPLRLGLLRVVAQQGLGVAGPGLHGGGGLADRQRDERGNQFGFVLGEQGDGAVLEVGDDGLDLAT